MKNLLTVSVFLFLLCGSVHAQIKLGIRGGVSSASIDTDDLLLISQNDLDTLKIKADNAKLGFRIGLFSRIDLGVLYIQPELLLRTAGMEYSRQDLTTGEVEFREENFLYFDIPVLVGTRLGPIRVQAGPVASILLSDESDFIDRDTYARSFKDAEWGFQLGGGFDLFKKLAVDLNYQINLTDSEDGINFQGRTFQLQSETGHFILGVAYIF